MPNSQPFAWSIFSTFFFCPIRSLRFEETIREQRSRRDSEKCIVQLTGAVTLLAEPYCIKHPRFSGGENGENPSFLQWLLWVK